MKKLSAINEPSLPTRIQAEDVSLSGVCGMPHLARVTSWATGLSQSTLPLAPDTAATKAQGVGRPGGQRWRPLGQSQTVACHLLSSFVWASPHDSPFPLAPHIPGPHGHCGGPRWSKGAGGITLSILSGRKYDEVVPSVPLIQGPG